MLILRERPKQGSKPDLGVSHELGSGLIDPEDDGCGNADCRQEGMGASVVSGGDAPPVLEVSEQVINFVALPAEPFVVSLPPTPCHPYEEVLTFIILGAPFFVQSGSAACAGFILSK